MPKALVVDQKIKEYGKDKRGTFSSMYLTRLEWGDYIYLTWLE